MTLATGRLRGGPASGQSLVEVLLALALMVLALGVAVVSLGAGRARSSGNVALDEVAAVLQQVRREAVSEGRTLAIYWEGGRRVLTWREGARSLPVEEELRFAPPEDAIKRVAPLRIFFRPDGSCDPFSVVLGSGRPEERRWRVDPWTARLIMEEKRP